jgi:hypothetical protein
MLIYRENRRRIAMPIARCPSCNKRYRVPQAGKSYNCICGDTVRAEPEAIEAEGNAPGKKSVPSGKPASDRPERPRLRRNLKRKQGIKKKILFAGLLVVLVSAATVVPYLLTKPVNLKSMALRFMEVWNDTGGLEDPEGISEVVEFFPEKTRDKVKTTLTERFETYKWLKRKPLLSEPLFTDLDEEGNLDDGKFKSYGLFYHLETSGFKMPVAVKWVRNPVDHWRIGAMDIPPVFRDAEELRYRFMVIWNYEDDIETSLKRIGRFFLEEEREARSKEIEELVHEKGWQSRLPKIDLPWEEEGVFRTYGSATKADFPIQGTGECLRSFWVKPKYRWYVKELMVCKKQ